MPTELTDMTWGEIVAACEAVSEQDEPPLWSIYQTAGKNARDDYAGSAYALDPVAALENYALGAGITDYSIDQDEQRVFLCPAHSRIFFYTYTTA